MTIRIWETGETLAALDLGDAFGPRDVPRSVRGNIRAKKPEQP